MSAFVFDSNIAKEYGINCAVMINCMQFWINKNKANNNHYYDGHYWMYNSIDAFTKLLPFFSAKQIRSILEKLISVGVLITENYNRTKYDRTLWYAFKDEQKFLEQNEKNNVPKKENRKTPDGKNDLTSGENSFAQMGKPIPVKEPYKKPECDIISARTRMQENFTPPTLEEMLNYARMMNQTAGMGGFHCTKQVAEEFWSYYTANGWVVGNEYKTPILDWKAKFRQWVINEKKNSKDDIPDGPRFVD